MRFVNYNLKVNYNIANLITLIKLFMIYIHVQKQGVNYRANEVKLGCSLA